MHIVGRQPVAGFQPGIVIRDIVHRAELDGPQGQRLQRNALVGPERALLMHGLETGRDHMNDINLQRRNQLSASVHR